VLKGEPILRDSMICRTAIRLAPLSLVLVLGLVFASAASADHAFNRGQVEGLAVEGSPFVKASFQNLHAEFDECGKLPNEESCTWSVEVVVHYAAECGGEKSTVLWSSGPITGNGSIDSGPQSIDLQGCAGGGLALTQSFSKTYGPWEGPGDPPPYYQTGAEQTIGLLLPGTLREAEERIVSESPAAVPSPMPEPPRFAVDPGCRTATIGPTRLAFRFKGMGCWKASQIAAAARRGGNPNGFRCKRRANGGFKCTRNGQPKKYVDLGSRPQRTKRSAR
jgi:hypothetical protein